MTDPAADMQTRTTAEVTARQKRLYATQLLLFFGTLILTIALRIRFNADVGVGVLFAGMAAMAMLKCPSCGKRIMIHRGTLYPRRSCIHCNRPDSEPTP
jgi:hypothetical protein